MIAVRNILLALVAVGAYGQPLRCVMNAGVPPTVRFEGLAEVAGDVVLNCTGGTPSQAGAPVPHSDVTIFLDANVTSRVLSISADTWTEALLMIDEPHSSYHPAVPLLACGDAGAPDGVGAPGVCAINGTGDGNNVYDGSASRPNVWQGRMNGDRSITWRGIPIDAPPVGGTRVIRITNVRINPSALAEVPAVVNMGISLGGANIVPVVTDSNQPVSAATVAFVMAGVQTAVFSATSFQQNQSHNPDLASGANYGSANADFMVRFTEGFQSVFKQKNWGYSTATALEQNQNIPGAVYNTESLFENIGPAADPSPNPPPQLVTGSGTVAATAAFPSYHGMAAAGEADGGTRLMLSFANVPSGVSLFVPTSVPLIGTPFAYQAGQTTGIAYLVATDSNGAGSSRISSIAGGAITGCSSNITDLGGTCPVSTGLAKVVTSSGSGRAVYEVYSGNPFSPEQVSVPVAAAYIYNANPGGEASPTAGLQTILTPSFAPLSSVGTASSNDPIPRFTASATSAQNLFTIAKAQPAFTGYVDNASCQAISGWAADRNQPGLSIPVSIYDGATLLAKITAGTLRSDVGTSLSDNGLHGFSYTFPSGIRDGNAHSIRVVFDSGTTDLAGSPKTLNCTPRYAGSIDTTSCSGITGWAADRNIPNTPITVSLWEGNNFIQTAILANAARPDVGAFLGDNGLHGFTIFLGPGYVGRTHTLHVRYESSATLVGAPYTFTCGTVAPNFAGSVDKATCSGITGWVADRNQVNTAIKVSLWDSGVQIASALANLSRPDVGAVLGDNGLHGFSFALPPGYANGIGHTFEVRYQTEVQEPFDRTPFPQVYGSPFTLTCAAATNYAGYVEGASCSGITGWVADRNRPNVPIVVSLWDGATQIASTTAGSLRSDVGTFLGDNGLHAFKLTLPSAYVNGVAHSLQVHYESSASLVPNGAVGLTCSSGVNYAGYVDSASCNGITGWAADRNRLNTPIVVSLWDGSTQIASTTASGVRADVGTSLGDNGAHGFSLAIPSAYANGVLHSLQIRYETSASQLPGSSASLTCGAGAPTYTGSVDVLSCSTISGWAADRNALNSSININIYDGATFLLSTPANGLRSDVGAYLGDTGLHGFGIVTPGLLKDGQAHIVTVRPGSSSSPLYGQQSLTCQP